MKLYKYVGPDVVGKMFGEDDTVLLKCSLPIEFNDPYELFLTVDFNIGPRLLAFYQDVVGDIVQTPTACFSRAPDVVPMWAHYGAEGQGAVIEFDEHCLVEAYPDCRFDDVEYRDGADPLLTNHLRFAAGTLKFRHAHVLQGAVLWAAYFTKASAWSYERERRVVVPEPGYLEPRGDYRFLVVHRDCVTGLLSGPRTPGDISELLRQQAAKLECPYYETVIGRLTPRPFFKSADGTYVFDGNRLSPADYICWDCGEPLGVLGERCSWCSVGGADRAEAAADNPLRLLDRYGLLDGYRNRRFAPGASAPESDQ
jgi:Protein of unknown function (DUF2971)